MEVRDGRRMRLVLKCQQSDDIVIAARGRKEARMFAPQSKTFGLFCYRNRGSSQFLLRAIGATLVAIFTSLPTSAQSDLDFSNQVVLDANTPERWNRVFSLDIGGIWLSRSTPDFQELVFDQSSNPVFNANQLQGDMGSGLDATVGLLNFFSDCNAWMFSSGTSRRAIWRRGNRSPVLNCFPLFRRSAR